MNGAQIPCSSYPNDVAFLETWAHFKSPCFYTASGTCPNFNPLSTTKQQGACGVSINSVGVQRYADYQTGSYAEAATIASHYYQNIQQGLLTGQTLGWYAQNAEGDFNTWCGAGCTYGGGFYKQLTGGSPLTLSATGPTAMVNNCQGGSANGQGGGSSSSSSGFTPTVITTNGFIFAGNIPLSYSSNDFGMNIVAYMANGGPFNSPAIAKAYAGVNGLMDSPDYHHPFSITDSKGILYVIDNWTFSVSTSTGNYPTSILMLRAFGENGTEIPINPTLINTLAPLYGGPSVTGSGSGIPGLGGANVPANGWPPYGWVLSANIMLPSGQSGSQSTVNSVSYCVLDCTYDASSVDTAYPPIGPLIEPEGGYFGQGANDISISSDFNGTLYLIAHPWSYTIEPEFYSTGEGGGITLFVAKPQNPLYSELAVLRPNLQNYTKFSYADNSSFICYLNQSPEPNSPCIYNANTEILKYVYPPILGVPNSFDFVENLGGPEQYLNVQNEVSALFPTGVNR